MIRIVLCEDDRRTLEEVTGMIKEILVKEKLPPARVESFADSNALLEKIRLGERAAIYVLDVEMPGADGFEIARTLQEGALPSQEDAPAVIFLTSHEERSTEGYFVRAFRYVVKTRMEKELPEAITSAIRDIRRKIPRTLILHHQGVIRKVRQDEILYIQRERRKLELHLSNGEILTDPRGVSELAEELEGPFIRISPSEIVNGGQVRSLKESEIVLKDGTVLAVTRRRMTQVKEALIGYWKSGILSS